MFTKPLFNARSLRTNTILVLMLLIGNSYAYQEDNKHEDATGWNRTDFSATFSISRDVVLRTSFVNLHPTALGPYDEHARDPLKVGEISIEANMPADMCFGYVTATKTDQFIDRSDAFYIMVDGVRVTDEVHGQVNTCYTLNGAGDPLLGEVAVPGNVGGGVWQVTMTLYSRYH